MTRFTKIALAAALVAGSASMALAEDSSSAYDNQLDGQRAISTTHARGMTSRSVSMQNRQGSKAKVNQQYSKPLDGGAK